MQAKVASGQAPLSKLYDHIKLEPSQIRRLPAPKRPAKQDNGLEQRLQIGTVQTIKQPFNILSEAQAFRVTEGNVRVMGVISEGAASVRVRFTNMSLPDGATVFVYSLQNQDEFYGPYEGHGLSDDGTFWTPPITGDGAVIEYFIPGSAKETSTSSPFEVTEVSHTFADPLEQAAAGSCNYDVSVGYANAAKAVGHLRFMVGSGEFICTGTLLNTRSNSFVPYLITANHCFSTQASAQSLRVYWNYNSGNDPPFGTSYTDGANLLATASASDFTFVRLTGNVPGGLWYNGWTTAMPSLNTSVVGIHHPRGSYKRISFGYIDQSLCPTPTNLPGPCANFQRVTWNYGITEPGSSGSELLVGSGSDPYYVGNLWGGNTSCSNPTGSSWYGRFDVTYPYISSYLEGSCPVSSITSPSNNSTLTSSTVTFNWGPTCATQYYFDVGNTQGSRDIYGNYASGGSTTVSGLPTDGRRIYVRLWSYLNGVWQYNDYSYLTRGAAAQITSPANGSTFPSSTVTFNWGPVTNGVSYYLDLNSSPGSRDIYANFVSGGSTTVSGIPTDGRTIYVRMWSFIGGVWLYNDYTYKAASSIVKAAITSPANGSTFPSSTVTFNWGPVSNSISYYLELDSSPGSRDIFANFVTGGSTTVSGIPTDGRTVYVRLWSLLNGVWQYYDYTYKANTSVGVGAQILSPANGSTFGATTITFNWSTVAGASQYYLDLNSSPGSRDIFANFVSGGSTTVSGIPNDGRTIYVRMWSLIGGVWFYRDYTYKACAGCAGVNTSIAQITSPTNGSTFASSTVTFTWNPVAGASQYFLDLNSTPGSRDIFANYVTGGSTTVFNIPIDGRTIYVRMWTNIGGVWFYNAYTYTARR